MRDAALLMADTRPPRPIPRRSSELSYVQMAAWVNWRYACAHGYDLLFLQLAEAGCRHAAAGHRHPSYCKLPAIAAALDAGYRTVAFLDSDSWFRPGSPSLEAIVRGHRGPGGADRDPAVYFAWGRAHRGGGGARHVRDGGAAARRRVIFHFRSR